MLYTSVLKHKILRKAQSHIHILYHLIVFHLNDVNVESRIFSVTDCFDIQEMNEHILEYEVQKLGEFKPVAFKSSYGNFLLSAT